MRRTFISLGLLVLLQPVFALQHSAQKAQLQRDSGRLEAEVTSDGRVFLERAVAVLSEDTAQQLESELRLTCASSNQCTQGSYCDPTSKTCESCSDNCRTCDVSADRCLTCPDGKILKDNACRDRPVTCPEGQFVDTAANVCADCSSKCVTCSDKDTCLTCVEGKRLRADTGECVQCLETAHCGAGRYCDKETFGCKLCSKNCDACDISAEHCTACKPLMALGADFKCSSCSKDGCSKGEYCDVASGACKACDPSCETCIGPGDKNCASCGKNQFLTYGVCGQCSAQCTSCDKRGDNCTGCPDGQVLDNGNCVNCRTNDDCRAGKFCNVDAKQCQDCGERCSTCGSANTCLGCKDGFHFDGMAGACTTCLDAGQQCASNQICDGDSGQCKDCHPSCTTCSGTLATQCLTCPEGQTLLFTGVCAPCEGACKSCKDNAPAVCTACKDEKLHLKTDTGVCVACFEDVHCDSGSFCNTEKNVCEACQAPCTKCSGRADKCDACPAGMLLSDVGNKCTTCADKGCKDNEYCHVSGACKACHETCLTCSGSLSTECLSCPDQRFLTPSQDGWSCNSCSIPCGSCKWGDQKCTTCIDGFFLQEDNSCAQAEGKPVDSKRPDPFATTKPLVFNIGRKPTTTTPAPTQAAPAPAAAAAPALPAADATGTVEAAADAAPVDKQAKQKAILKQLAEMQLQVLSLFDDDKPTTKPAANDKPAASFLETDARVLQADSAEGDDNSSPATDTTAAPAPTTTTTAAPSRLLADGTVVVFGDTEAFQVQIVSYGVPSASLGTADPSNVYLSHTYFALKNAEGKYLQLVNGRILLLSDDKVSADKVKGDRSFWFKFADVNGQNQAASSHVSVLDNASVDGVTVWPVSKLSTGSSLCVTNHFLKVCQQEAAVVFSV